MKFTKSPVANLYKGEPSGVYFIRAKILGKLFRRSLKTKSFEIAKMKIKKAHADELERRTKAKESEADLGDGTMSAVMEKWLKDDQSDPDLKERTRDYHAECVEAIKKVWPSLAKMEAGMVSEMDCLEFGKRLRQKYSATRFNGAVDVLRKVFSVAIARGLRVNNPAKAIQKVSVKQKELHLPTHEQFKAMLEIAGKGKKRREAFILIRFLAYTGMRVNEAAQVTAEMVDWNAMEFKLPGSITKNGLPRRVPIIPEMEPLLRQLESELKLSPERTVLLPTRTPRRALKSLCELVEVKEITNHDLRHLFATRCIEAGVDVKTIAAWMGHQDGGALLLKTYAHLRNEHSREMAAKVKFA